MNIDRSNFSHHCEEGKRIYWKYLSKNRFAWVLKCLRLHNQYENCFDTNNIMYSRELDFAYAAYCAAKKDEAE